MDSSIQHILLVAKHSAQNDQDYDLSFVRRTDPIRRPAYFEGLFLIAVVASPLVTGNNQRLSFLSRHRMTRPRFEEAYYAQLRATAAVLRGAGISPTEIHAFLSANVSPDWTDVRIEGGNFHFAGADNFLALVNGCPQKRCDEGRLGTLDLSHDRNSVHLDTADPYNFPEGAFEHFIVDVIGGNYWYAVIPR